MSERPVRVRFAPSPTGPLHMGGVRTALFNYLFAKKLNGTFILRIEDTDQGRYVPGAEEYIIESLKWCNLHFDEGVSIGGPYGPYRQSDRKAIYKQYADQLISSGKAYYAFDTPEELEEMRKKLEAAKSDSQQYDSSTRLGMKNSLTLSADEVQRKLANNDPYVIRIKIPANEEVKLFDLIRGEVVVYSSKLDDKVLFKSDGMPTYHLANVVDDYLMKISHVIRGEEWLPSTPLHVLLYRYLGWEDVMPQFAHLPLLLKPDGKGKLNKRDGDRLGFPVFPLRWIDPISKEVSSGYRESGYFPEAFVNMLAFLGWNPGTTQEIFSHDELIQSFSLDKVSKSGAKFDHEKAKWFNHQYLKTKTNKELAELFKPVLNEKGIIADDSYVEKVCAFLKDRANLISEFWEKTSFFFQAPDHYDEAVVKKVWKPETSDILKGFISELKAISTITTELFDSTVNNYLAQKGIGKGQLMNALRLCLVGSNTGPDIVSLVMLIGKDEAIQRIEKGINQLRC
jgi:glutamyl-tRNA synthetase